MVRQQKLDIPEPIPGGMYPIRMVASLTGINPVTLRAWERRYGLVKPQRTPKGHRLYSEQDIELIKRILKMLDQNIPISQVKHLLSNKPQPANVATIIPGEDPWFDYRTRMMNAVVRYDPASL